MLKRTNRWTLLVPKEEMDSANLCCWSILPSGFRNKAHLDFWTFRGSVRQIPTVNKCSILNGSSMPLLPLWHKNFPGKGSLNGKYTFYKQIFFLSSYNLKMGPYIRILVGTTYTSATEVTVFTSCMVFDLSSAQSYWTISLITHPKKNQPKQS